MQMQSPWGSNEFETFKSENRSCLAGVEWVGLSRRGWGWRGSWGVFLMNILAMARNLDFIQSIPGIHWKFLKQGGTNSDFCFKWLFWILPEWNLGCKGSKVIAETLARGCCRGPGRGWWCWGMLPCEQNSLSLDNHLLLGYSVVFLPFQISGAGQDRVNPLPQVCSPCLLLVGSGDNYMGLALGKLQCLKLLLAPLVESHCYGAQETLLTSVVSLGLKADWDLHAH